MTDSGTGRISRVAGPLVEADGIGEPAMFDLVELGSAALPGEIVAIRQDSVRIQAYEYTGGLAPGQPAVALGRPLSARLGPGLLGGVFDGLLRPLSGPAVRLVPGAAFRADATVRWSFTPVVAAGREVGPGALLGTVPGSGPVQYRILVPPGVGGPVEKIVGEGRYPADQVVATVGGVDVALTTAWPVRRPRPARSRMDGVEPLGTGQRVLDLLYPVARGGTAAVPGGFGTGKTVLLQQLAKWCDADVIVYVGCGERGNELADISAELLELTDPRTGGRLLDRIVIIANTSNMPMMAREASIYSGMTVAEYFRDMGYHVVLIADSTSRWAEALREFASRTGALPAEEGYPADLASALAAFYERAGAVVTLGGERGSVTVVGAVSPAGGDLAEPVTALTERFVRCKWTLDRDLAYARHYPAVSWSGSFSRDATAVGAHHAGHGDPGWPGRRARVLGLLGDADRLGELADLVGVGALPDHERIVVLAGRLLRDSVLQQSALSANDAYCDPAKTAALVDAVLSVVDRCLELVAAGLAATAIEECDFGPLVRAREETGPRDAAGVGEHRDQMLAQLGELSEVRHE
ncbi:MAG TPA: V-type ATP synthase subunit A [Actinophytocola sp.]|uniref:V-type ATP synthase subunit A n=1 Tax=Actinophytocola sp. TaxID=1872138 RepID=UPI002DBD7136|nr:V-type ATP synthase subunit A [Actinophytocola sp.]HEU5469321.1 V-type ATP synthase subunit A [Actinophytocola sp.]